MKEPNNPETLKKRGWSIIRKTQVIGTIIGGLSTIGIVAFCAVIPPQHLFDFSSLLLILTVVDPLTLICKVFGLSLKLDNGSGGFAFFPLCLVFIMNSVLGFLLGSLVGQLIKYKRAKGR